MHMLYIIGLGLNDENDISLKGLEAMRQCDEVYCELYTNKWNGSLKTLEDMAGKTIAIIDREKTESGFLVDRAQECIAALLVPGDPLSATTHFELYAECMRRGIHAEAVHSSSIFTAIAQTGLDLYKFGRTTTITKPQKGFDPESPHEIIKENMKAGLHTLALLDIGMTAKEGAGLMIKHGAIRKDRMIAACFAMGSRSQKILYDTTSNIVEKDFKDVPCCIAVPGKLNDKEQEFLDIWKTSRMR